jgi:hypothetical protein
MPQMFMEKLEQRESVVRCVVGMTGSGKTTKAVSLVADCPRVLYYDTLCEDYSDGVVFDDPRRLGAFWEHVCAGSFRLVYRPDDPNRDFPLFCEQVYDVCRMAFVVDEAHQFCRCGKCIDVEFTHLIGKGRHRDINLVCMSQAPKQLSDFLRSQAHEWFIFMLKEPAHVKYIVERCGGLVSAADITSLRRFEYLHYRDYGVDGTPDVRKCKDDLTTGTTYFEPLSDDCIIPPVRE